MSLITFAIREKWSVIIPDIYILSYYHGTYQGDHAALEYTAVMLYCYIHGTVSNPTATTYQQGIRLAISFKILNIKKTAWHLWSHWAEGWKRPPYPSNWWIVVNVVFGVKFVTFSACCVPGDFVTFSACCVPWGFCDI